MSLADCTIEWYIYAALERPDDSSFRNDWLRAFFVEDIRSRNIPPDLESRLFRKLQMIDDAGLHSIRVNQQWRLVFHWDGSRGEAAGVYLDDHSYR